ncbi:glycosyltransferase family 9 protein [Sporomusa sp. GT1]|uniref:glycosyltransferase family 9 protein n=1 Tax=Sporomusa sp. GT1 TaxID=1534747 RepID=UPI00166760CC|nr:glycosyltransferase family 9 protein [Sporomusa sp. GT1]
MDKENANREVEYFNHTKESLIEFCRMHKRIFLYGAGIYGEWCFHFLKEQNIHVEGFLVTDNPNVEYLGIPIYLANEKIPLMCSETGIIFSLKKSFREEIKNMLINVNNVDFFEIEDCFFQQYQLIRMVEAIQRNGLESIPVKLEKKSMDWHKILVIRLDAIGDMIWTTPFFRELKRNFPESEVSLVSRKDISLLLAACPYIDNNLIYDCTLHEGAISIQMEKRAKSFAKQYLQTEKYDVVFLPRHLPTSPSDCLENVLLALYSGAKYRVARADYVEEAEKRLCDRLENLFSVVVKHEQEEHEVLRTLRLLEACGGRIENNKMEIWLHEKDIDFAHNLLSREDGWPILIAVAPVANSKLRSWDSVNYIHVINDIAKRYRENVRFVLLGGANASHVHDLVAISQLDNVLNLINKTTLLQTAAIIKNCDMYLGSNTGLLHMASVFEKPIIEISACLRNGKKTGLLSPERTGAWRVHSEVIRPTGLDECKDWCRKPYAHCINQITIEEVLIKLEQMITMLKKQRCTTGCNHE